MNIIESVPSDDFLISVHTLELHSSYTPPGRQINILRKQWLFESFHQDMIS